MDLITPVILAGGSGARLWPKSRAHYPKQFLPLTSSRTMLQETVSRVSCEGMSKPLIICNEEHRFIAAEQLREADFQHGGIVLEPIARNTAPAIAVAALQALKSAEDPTLLVIPADHAIGETAKLLQAVTKAQEFAQSGQLVMLGVVPDSPHTGFGYIRAGKQLDAGFQVKEFIEKPKRSLAASLIASGECYWNSGIFLFRARDILEEIGKYCPKILRTCQQAVDNAQLDLEFIRLESDVFEDCPASSIDFAVMEKTSRAVMIPLCTQWSDVGSWPSLWQISEKDGDGNAANGRTLLKNVTNSYINAEKRLVAAVDLDNIVVIETKDSVLVANKDSAEDVREIVNTLKSRQWPEYTAHPITYRPWGSYESIDKGERYQVKRISVKPGGRLSLQMHHHRSEHWVVVSGTATVTIDGKQTILTENESAYVPLGSPHSLENAGRIPLELIEVQSGAYLEEDDIIRYNDIYNREK